MKLIIWNKENSYSPSKSAEHRTIRVNRHGYIYLSGALAAEMDLKHGSRLNKTQDETGFLLRGDRHKELSKTKRHAVNGVEFSNVCLATKLLALVKTECFSVRFLVAKEPVEVEDVKYYKILTSNPIPGQTKSVTKK